MSWGEEDARQSSSLLWILMQSRAIELKWARDSRWISLFAPIPHTNCHFSLLICLYTLTFYALRNEKARSVDRLESCGWSWRGLTSHKWWGSLSLFWLEGLLAAKPQDLMHYKLQLSLLRFQLTQTNLVCVDWRANSMRKFEDMSTSK